MLKRVPRVKSNRSTARISDMFPSLTTSKKRSDAPTCFLAMLTTRRRLASTIRCLIRSQSSIHDCSVSKTSAGIGSAAYRSSRPAILNFR